MVFNPALSRIEFKIFYNIFCESFRLKLTTFAFDSYVELVFEKFILGLIHIDMFNWVFICAVLGLEWFRLGYFHLFADEHTYIHTYIQKNSYMCVSSVQTLLRAWDTVNVFLLFGAAMYVWSCAMLYITRWDHLHHEHTHTYIHSYIHNTTMMITFSYTYNHTYIHTCRYYIGVILHKKGVWSVDFYPSYIFYMETLTNSEEIVSPVTILSQYVMYVCMYVCTYECMYICMYVCMKCVVSNK